MHLSLKLPARPLAGAAGFALLLCLTAAFARPASATTYPPDCADGHVCLYRHSDWRVKIFDISNSQSGLFWNVPTGLVSSWANRSWGTFAARYTRRFGPGLIYPALWTMWPRSSERWVGHEDNDRASRLARGVGVF